MFYPIPSLENKYEINKHGVVRNARTKKIKVTRKDTTSYHFRVNNSDVWRCNAALMAEVFDKDEEFLPVPSLENKYEINKQGVVRNAKTKKKIKQRTIHKVPMIDLLPPSGKQSSYSVAQLLWEVWGKLPEKTNKAATGVYLSKNGRNIYFPSMYKASFFLAKDLFWTQSTMEKKLNRRVSEIEGWKIFYREEEKRTIKAKRVCEVGRRNKTNESN